MRNINACFIAALPTIVDNGYGRPPKIEAASTKFYFTVAVDDNSSASNADNPPDKVVPPSVPDDNEPAVADTPNLEFDPYNLPDSAATLPPPVSKEPLFINISPSTSFNPAVKPSYSIFDLPLSLLADLTYVSIDSPGPEDTFPETIYVNPLFPEVSLPVENS